MSTKNQTVALVTGSAMIALHKTTGTRAQKHCCVLYIAVNKDWGSRQLERNGNHGLALATAPMTPEAIAYRGESYRARSLQYNGKPPADADGLAADLRSLGYDDATVARFLDPARGVWPNT